MASKYQMFADLAEQKTKQITSSMEDWTGFLATAGRLYKYPFEEQLMIHAQRPDVIACAPLEIWNKPMNRWVKRGSKGIALLDNSGDRSRLKYVFDVVDTQDGRYNPRRPFLWELKQEHEMPVVEALKSFYNIDVANDMGWQSNTGRVMLGNYLGDYLYTIAQNLAARYYENNRHDIAYAVEDSFLHGLDEFNVSVAFRDALTVSTAYAMMSRCGLDPADYIENEDFQPIFDFNTPESVYALGKAVSDVSEEVLREIEVTIKKYERQKAVDIMRAAPTGAREEGQRHEHGSSQTINRNNLQPERGLSDTRHSNTRNDRIAGEIRHNEEEVPARPQGDNVLNFRNERNAVPPLSASGEPSQRAVIADDGRTPSTEPAAGQSDRPDGLDGTHEQSAITSGSGNIERDNLQLDEEETPPTPTNAIDGVSVSPATAAEQQVSLFSLFPTEQEQIDVIREALHNEQQAEQTATPPPITPISQEDIDNAIIKWNGDIDSKIRVSEYMHEHARARDTANFLKNEYGLPVAFADGRIVSVDENAFTVTKDGADPNFITLPWAKVQRRIAQLMDEDKFLSTDERAIADNALTEVWESLAEENAVSVTTPAAEVQAIEAQAVETQAVEPLTPTVEEQIREVLSRRGYAVSDELIAAGIEDYGWATDSFYDVADFIQSEYLTEEPELEPIIPLAQQGEESILQPELQAEQVPTKPYAIGDTVYLENDRRFIIDDISEFAGRTDVKLLDTNLYIPIFRSMELEYFEQEFYRNPLNNAEPPLEETPAAADTPAVALGDGTATAPNPTMAITDFVQSKLESGEKFTSTELFAEASKAFGDTMANNAFTSKDAYDAMELGVNQYILSLDNVSPEDMINRPVH